LVSLRFELQAFHTIGTHINQSAKKLLFQQLNYKPGRQNIFNIFLIKKEDSAISKFDCFLLMMENHRQNVGSYKHIKIQAKS